MAIDTVTPRSRRALLAGLLGGAATALTATLVGAQRVLAAGDDGQVIHVGDRLEDARSTTRIQNASNNSNAFEGTASGGVGVYGVSQSAWGVAGFSSNVGVYGSTGVNGGFGVVGKAPFVAIKGESSETGGTNGSGVGVYGTSKSTDGAGVDGRSPNVGVHGQSGGVGVHGQGTSGGIGVRGQGKGGGIGVLGNSDSYRAVVGVVSADTGNTIGVMGESFSEHGTGVRGWAAGEATGVYGFSGGSFPSGSPPSRTGVYGSAPKGRGGLFKGGKAQIRLVPSTASSHPSSGALGDLYLDKNGRLWFCKGGSNWKQLA